MLIDVIILLILVACVLSGYRKGLLMSLMGVLILVLCCLGATAARNTLTPRVVRHLEPQITQALLPSVQQELQSTVSQQLEATGETSFTVGGQSVSLGELMDLLRQFGVDVQETVSDGVSGSLEQVAQATARGVAHALAEKVGGVVIFAGTFLILFLVLQSVALAVNLVDRLPVIHGLNRAGGVVFSLAGAVLVLTVLAATCQDAALLPEEPGPLTLLLLELANCL